MAIAVPYETTGQQIGETRKEMGKRIMKDLEEIIEHPKCRDVREKYYVVFHAKPWPKHPNVIKIKKMVVFHRKPPMMLSCMCFGVDNSTGVLTLEWALPGSWPVWSVGGTNEPVPEVLGSLKELSKTCNLDKVLVY